MPVFVPPPDEQRAITDFLDEQTSRIDALIAKQTQLITTLRERRTAAVMTVLASGLRGGEARPDGRISWLTSVPVSWTVSRLSWVFGQIGSGTTPANEDQLDAEAGDVAWVTTSELREATITATRRTVSLQTVANLSALQVYPQGSLLIAMYGATVGRIGTLGIPAATNQACCALAKCTSGSARFFYFVLLAAREHLIARAVGAGQPNINQDTIRSLRVPVPPHHEQFEIAAHLDQLTARIDRLIDETEQHIALATERRAALIAAAVAGQFNVRLREGVAEEVA
ncbi:restriction endonuclease subunit S [Cellulomonas fengjieae]|uniref:Restriction endonuclease subunit S n=1 Tax=Cellulomonas fengjieae TaxID=2819978 RepID=A0ABS3SBA8_9CELL|nr:restriction endonuclease subunit S [Cellulomonas fengjieae]MBO3083025.1 restriction endonuclease subunit S [Cellulomonas fengjieae]QVI65604.1 restriction endonuclease subunit S [Cellulomonas fengjieae]